MANHQPHIPGGGVLVSPGAVDPKKAIEAQIRTMRIGIAADTMVRLVAAVASRCPERLEPGVDELAKTSVVAADCLLRELSKGPFALPIEWKDEAKQKETG